MRLEEALGIVERIDHGVRDAATCDLRFAPVWEYPFLREALLGVLQAYAQNSMTIGDELRNFETICELLAPDFVSVLLTIECPVVDTIA